MTTPRIAILIAFAALSSSLHAEEKRKLLFSDDFEGRTEPGENYRTSLAHGKAWTVKDGVLIGIQTNPDHGAVIRKQLDFNELDLEIDFRFNGGKSFNFVIDDKNEKSVHAGHICRVSVFPKRLIVGDDKTGTMNLEVRKQRKAKNLPEDEQKALDKLLAATRTDAKITVSPNKWHTLGIRITGDLMEASLDGKLVAKLKSPGFAHPTKTQLGMTINGNSIDFDNFKIYAPK